MEPKIKGREETDRVFRLYAISLFFLALGPRISVAEEKMLPKEAVETAFWKGLSVKVIKVDDGKIASFNLKLLKGIEMARPLDDMIGVRHSYDNLVLFVDFQNLPDQARSFLEKRPFVKGEVSSEGLINEIFDLSYQKENEELQIRFK